jgi:hypothetical protein
VCAEIELDQITTSYSVYFIRNIWTGRVYIGVTSKTDPLNRLEEHIKGSCNAELASDFKTLGVESFQFRVAGLFANKEVAYRAEQAEIEYRIPRDGVYSMYNRCAGGLPSFYGRVDVPPPHIRESLLGEVRKKGNKLTEKGAAKAAGMHARRLARRLERGHRWALEQNGRPVRRNKWER